MLYRQRKHAARPSFHVQPGTVDVEPGTIDDIVNFLNLCQLPKDAEQLKAKLKDTVELRRALLSQNDQSYPKMFDFYLIDPEMVRYILMKADDL